MAAKRFFHDDDDDDQSNHKRPKTRFASVIREVVMVNFFENFCSALEPMLRRVVSEEVENELRRRRTATGNCPISRMLPDSAAELCSTTTAMATASLRLAFTQRLSLPIFTGTKIVGADGNSLQMVLVDAQANKIPHAVKVEIVVLDGDFPKDDAPWTDADFDKSIVKERTGKRPLLAGDLCITMRDGVASVAGDIEFTDNSSWIRSRKFRIGARALPSTSTSTEGGAGGGVIIHSAITEPFVVKDHRGELYKKHHPPALEDQVWRLEKIGKGGAFHQKLAAEGISTVQDFLKLFHVNPNKLRKILGGGMSEKMWEATLKHAKECVVGNKLYKLHAGDCTLTFSPVCQLIGFESNGQVLHHHTHFRTTMQTAYIESLVKDAYAKWDRLEIVEGPLHQTQPLLLTQGEVTVEQYSKEEYLKESEANYSDESIIYGDWNIPH
ncbi:protein SAR DEFICIENT 1 [Andrographis paniculata]|uniref:protein SAR DEFICIENT 1 n=1 Tax=Andrographis paniculata TaxID=175694 RepID=UPI0021E73261|nr:protein SAR DEFICIENT 1 [Andrographis paniculata]